MKIPSFLSSFESQRVKIDNSTIESSNLEVLLRVRIEKILIIFAKESILMFEWLLDTPLTCLKKDNNCQKPVN